MESQFHKLVKGPSGRAIDEEGRIYVASADDKKVLLFNPNGECIKIFNSDELLRRPLELSPTQQGNPIVCDSHNKCMKWRE